MAAEKLLAAAMLVNPYRKSLDVEEETERAVIDEDLPQLTPQMKMVLEKMGNPFSQRLAVVEKLARVAARNAGSIEDEAKVKRVRCAASRKPPMDSSDPELRRIKLLKKIDAGICKMGVIPETYLDDLARRLRIPLFGLPDKLDLETLTRAARMVNRDAIR
jgi:hypothetical protein